MGSGLRMLGTGARPGGLRKPADVVLRALGVRACPAPLTVGRRTKASAWGGFAVTQPPPPTPAPDSVSARGPFPTPAPARPCGGPGGDAARAASGRGVKGVFSQGTQGLGETGEEVGTCTPGSHEAARSPCPSVQITFRVEVRFSLCGPPGTEVRAPLPVRQQHGRWKGGHGLWHLDPKHGSLAGSCVPRACPSPSTLPQCLFPATLRLHPDRPLLASSAP